LLPMDEVWSAFQLANSLGTDQAIAV
jgi:hypothetical protein